jgi:NAD(P)-dependent dehydrogenase (short-subunit alcohol dehydrogenase family)
VSLKIRDWVGFSNCVKNGLSFSHGNIKQDRTGDRREPAAAVVSAIEKLGRRGAALQLDAGNVRSFDTFFGQLKGLLKDHFGADKFDVIINNAGIGIHALFAETTEEQFDTLSNLQLKGVFFLTQKALPMMNDGGSIINISTGLARFSGPGYSAYAAMKGGIEVPGRYNHSSHIR